MSLDQYCIRNTDTDTVIWVGDSAESAQWEADDRNREHGGTTYRVEAYQGTLDPSDFTLCASCQ